MNERQRLLRRIQMLDFILFETALFLDTHKTDKAALDYYNQHRTEANHLREEYTSKFGPLSIRDTRAEGSWEWTDGPWPWEYAAN